MENTIGKASWFVAPWICLSLITPAHYEKLSATKDHSSKRLQIPILFGLLNAVRNVQRLDSSFSFHATCEGAAIFR